MYHFKQVLIKHNEWYSYQTERIEEYGTQVRQLGRKIAKKFPNDGTDYTGNSAYAKMTKRYKKLGQYKHDIIHLARFVFI